MNGITRWSARFLRHRDRRGMQIANHSNGAEVDQTEITHFKSLSNEWWEPNGKLKELHLLNHVRVPFIRDGLIAMKSTDPSSIRTDAVLASKNILDVGCGGGILCEALARLNANITGLDPAEELISIAKEHASTDPTISGRIKYICNTIEVHSQEKPCFYDAVVASEVLEHVPNPKLFLEKCLHAVKPQGSLFITTINRTTLSWLAMIVGAEYVCRIVPINTHDWSKFIKPTELTEMIHERDTTVISINGLVYEPWKQTWRGLETTSLSYAVHILKE